jgi:hypothetical protein
VQRGISEHRDRLFAQVRGIITTRVKELKSSNEAAQAVNIHLTPAPDPIIIPMVHKSLNLSTAKKRGASSTRENFFWVCTIERIS